MDPLTHSLIGGLSAQTAGVSRRRFWIMFGLGSVMDLDIVTNWCGDWASFLQHRGISHSILGVVLQVVFFAFIFKRIDRGTFRERAFYYSIPLSLHLLCDYLTSFGIPLFLPFSLKSYSLGVIGCVNLIPMAIAGGTLIYMYLKDRSGWRAAGWAWITWGIYLGLVSFGKVYAANIAEGGPSLTPIPTLMNPFKWQAISADSKNHAYHRYLIDIWRRQTTHLNDIPMPNGDFPVRSSMASPLVREYLKNSVWPVVRMQKKNGGWEVEWGRLIFGMRGLVRGNILIEMDESGKIREEKKVVSFWNPETHS